MILAAAARVVSGAQDFTSDVMMLLTNIAEAFLSKHCALREQSILGRGPKIALSISGRVRQARLLKWTDFATPVP
jgi:hypothetical protein